MDPLLQAIATSMGVPIWMLILVLVWSLVWKACALWKAARSDHKIWFVMFFVVHTLGLIEILYLFLFSKMRLESKKRKVKKAR